MPEVQDQTERAFTILCLRCERPVIARRSSAGREVQCPHCSSVLRVPTPPEIDVPVKADPPNLAPKRFFNFPCPRCGCLLEAHTGMSGQHGACPTCAARFVVPGVKPRSGTPEKADLVDSPADLPTPLHAYAASGHQAPRLISRDDGSYVIECPRCGAHNPIETDACGACAAPFTLDAAPTIGRIRSDRCATASITLGIIGIFAFPILVPGAAAVWLGVRALLSAHSDRRTAVPIVGVCCGLVSIVAGVWFWVAR